MNRGIPAATETERNSIMSIKKIALIAATIAGTASIASADSYFQLNERLEASSILDLGIVRSEAAGVVEVYDFSGGQIGALLGTEAVNMGANADVRVNAPLRNAENVIALLKVDGQTVAERTYDIVD
jgi:hypothetical protein